MELTEQGLADVLVKSLQHDNNIRKEAEARMKALEAQQGVVLLILRLIALLCQPASAADSSTPAIRQAASVYFKNAIKRRWSPENTDDGPVEAIAINDRDSIKMHLVDLMSTTPSDVQRQLAEAVSIIAKYDFPHNWQTLLPQLVSKLDGDIRVIQGVMLTANSIFKKFRHCYKSDSLFQEIKDCLLIFQSPLLEMFKRNSGVIAHITTSGNKADLLVTMETHRLMARIYYSLNWQDIPEFFEDNIAEWMEEFMKFLTYKNVHLVDTNEDSEPGPIEKLQAAILENLTLYATKYEEEFNPYLGMFTQAIWQLLMEVGPQQKYDILATSSIKFLSSVCSKQMNVSLFTDQIIKDIVEHIVVKNITATEADEELFEDNPTDYIRKDMEGSDSDTRRRSAMDLVRALHKFFGTQTSQYCVGYIDAMLNNYNKTMDWKAKDAALHLFLSTSVLSSSSSGASELNPNVNVLSIFNSHVLAELSDPSVNTRPIVKADALKLICIFRSHLPVSLLLTLIPNIIAHLSSDYIVVQTYAALCLEKFLSLKDRNPVSGTMTARISNEHLQPHLQSLLGGLFVALANPNYPENDYIMKCIMRVLIVVGSDVSPIAMNVLPPLTSTLERVCKNPTNPFFNHYLFECIAILIKSVTSAAKGRDAVGMACSQFEALFFPTFQAILSQDVVEFVPYAFQILAQLLNARPDEMGLSDPYRALFAPLLSPTLWERKGNIPALTDLFRAYINKGMNDIVNTNHFEGVLGVFQKLLSLKSSESYAFKLLNNIIKSASLNTLNPYLPTIFGLLLTRLQEHMKDANKNPKYIKSFLHTLCFFAAVHGGQILETVFLSIDPSGGLLHTIIVEVWAPNSIACATNDKPEVRHVIIGGTNILCQTDIKQNPITWGSLLKSIVILLDSEGNKVGLDLDDNNSWGLDEDAADREFDNSYSKLAYAQASDPDLAPDIVSAPNYLAMTLCDVCRRLPGHFPSIIQQSLDHQQLQILQGVCQQEGVSLM